MVHDGWIRQGRSASLEPSTGLAADPATTTTTRTKADIHDPLPSHGRLAILVGALVVLAGCTRAPAPEPSSAPSHTSTPLGAKWVWAEFDQVKSYLPELNGGHTYVEVVLCDVEKSKGAFDWSVPDSYVTRARAVG